MIRQGTIVRWKRREGTGSGKVVESYVHPVTKNIEGNNYSRKGTQEDMALLIVGEDGHEVLKLESEVEETQ